MARVKVKDKVKGVSRWSLNRARNRIAEPALNDMVKEKDATRKRMSYQKQSERACNQQYTQQAIWTAQKKEQRQRKKLATVTNTKPISAMTADEKKRVDAKQKKGE